MGGSSIAVSLISEDSPSFKVSYCYQCEARRVVEEEKGLFRGEGGNIVSRMRKLFKRVPLLMFIFYT